MPTIDWLKKQFSYGYDSGNVLSFFPNSIRRSEEKVIGGSYRKFFLKAVLPHLKKDAIVLELGPGKGAWSKAILKHIPCGKLYTVDFQNVEDWLEPVKYEGRLLCHKVDDNSLSCLEDNFFDFFFSFGVLCHNNSENIKMILKNSLSKMKLGGIAVHQYADWDKLDTYGWGKGAIPKDFKDKPDDEIWWPRNTKENMSTIAREAGWNVICDDLGLFKRDSIILMNRKDV